VSLISNSIYYHFAILLLFRSLIKLRFIGSSILPRDVCAQAAEAITNLVRSYDQLYTLQRTPSFVPYIVLTAGIIHLVLGNTLPSKQFTQTVEDLRNMCSCHGFAHRGLQILNELARQWNIKIKLDLGDKDDNSKNDCGAEVQPIHPQRGTHMVSAGLFSTYVGDKLEELRPLGGSVLFNPFPMQGSPILGDKEQLERSGFAMLY
jgi:hypothetical protein